MSNPQIDFFKVVPLVSDLEVLVIWVNEVMHAWSYETFVEPQVRLDFLFCVENRVTILLSKHLFSLH